MKGKRVPFPISSRFKFFHGDVTDRELQLKREQAGSASRVKNSEESLELIIVIAEFVGSQEAAFKYKRRSLCRSREAALGASSIMFNTTTLVPSFVNFKCRALQHFVPSTGSVVFMFCMAQLGAVNVRAISICAENKFLLPRCVGIERNLNLK